MIASIGINLLIVFICTIGMALLKYKMYHVKIDKVSLLFSLIVGVTGSNFTRYIMFHGNELVSYRQHPTYLALDIMGILLFCYLFLFSQKSDNKSSTYIFDIAIYALIIICVGIKKYNEYNNIKSVIYDLLLPQILCISGGIVIFVECLICFFKNKKQYINIYKHDFLKKQVVICNLVFTLLLYPFLETYFSNLSEFDFSLNNIGIYIFITIFSVWILLNVLLLFESSHCNFIVCGMTILSVCGYVQGMFLNRHLFLMDGKEMEWSTRLLFGNVFIWLAFILSLSILLKKNERNVTNIVFTISGIMLAMQLTGLISIVFTADNANIDIRVKNDYFSNEGLYTAAQKNNTYVFVLDTFDVDYWNQILNEESDFAQPMEGFIYYPDTVSQFSRTYPSIPYMLSERPYFYEIPQQEYNKEAVPSCKIWEELLNNNYELYFYEESPEYIGDEIRYKSKNYVIEGKEVNRSISLSGTLHSMLQVGGYRSMPYFMKKDYLYTSEMINDSIIVEISYDREPFNPSDGVVYEEFKNGITISDDLNAFKFIHLNGAHAPYSINENCKIVDSKDTNLVEQCKGSMELVYKYLRELKQLGLYENSLIIVTADHGENYVTKELEQNTNPILFIKPINNDNVSMQISDIYASQNDIIPTIASQLNIAYDEKWGIDLLNTNGEDKERKRYHYYAVVENTLQTKDRTYEIVGSSLDFQNWRATDEYHEFLYY